MSSDEADSKLSPGELPPVATEEQLANQLRRVVRADSVVSDSPSSTLDTMKTATGIPKGDLTLTTLGNDPLNAGTTDMQHRKAQWAALLWKHAVATRHDDAIHTRGVHYVAVSAGITIPSPNPQTDDNPNGSEWDEYANATVCYGFLTQSLSTARCLGYIPYSGIIDEKNDRDEFRTTSGGHDRPHDGALEHREGYQALSLPSAPSFQAEARRHWDEKSDYNDRAIERATRQLMQDVRIDTEALQPYHIELWAEKTLPSEVKTTAKNAGCGVIVEGEGCMSYTQAFEFGERVQRIKKPAIVLYLSDFDPAGDGMAKQVANKFEWLKQNPSIPLDHDLYVEQLALTAEQVEQHDLPRKPINTDEKGYATRIEAFEEKHGEGATELNVLEADLDLYQRIVRDGIEQYRDAGLDQQVSNVKENYREACETAVREAIDEADVHDHLDEVADWLDDVDSMANSYVETVDSLQNQFADEMNELRQDDRYTEFVEAHESVRHHVDVPELHLPDSKLSPPSDPLYDSSREYLDTVARAKRASERLEVNR